MVLFSEAEDIEELFSTQDCLTILGKNNLTQKRYLARLNAARISTQLKTCSRAWKISSKNKQMLSPLQLADQHKILVLMFTLSF